MRHCSENLLGENLTSELTPFSFSMKHGGEDLRPAAHVYVLDLVQEIFHLLDQYDRLATNRINIHVHACTVTLNTTVSEDSHGMGISFHPMRYG